MNKFFQRLLAVLACAVVVLAQAPVTNYLTVVQFVGAPTGACGFPQVAVNISTADFYTCTGATVGLFNGTWQKMIAQPITANAGFVAFGQGAAQGHATANQAVWEAPAAVTAYEAKLPPVANTGVLVGVSTSGVITMDWSGGIYDTTSGGVAISDTASIGSTALCTTTGCVSGSYVAFASIEITTACATGGTYQINLVYTDDTTVSKTITFPLAGTGVTANVLAPTATTNYASGFYVFRSKGTVAVNYTTTAGACISGAMVGKLSMAILPLGA